MPIIKSISGIRGTIGGPLDDSLNPPNIMSFTCAYAQFIKSKNKDNKKLSVIVGRDARVSGEYVKNIVIGSLLSMGLDVIDLGMSSTPTVEMAVITQRAQGGIIISASHNPGGWNALKMLDNKGEFLTKESGEEVLLISDKNEFNFVNENEVGSYFFNPYLEWNHIHKIEGMPLVEKDVVEKKDFKIVVDGINSVGAKAMFHLLEMMGVKNQIVINDSMDGKFAHNPEPLEKNLQGLKEAVKKEKADLGIAVDPDVDRLAFIDEKGNAFGEENTLVAVAEYLFSNFSKIESEFPGKYNKIAVSNLSSSRGLADIAKKHGGEYQASAVGEVNVVTAMKESRAVIGGEGNGGIIFPELHYGRDALVGTALFISYLAVSGKKASEIKDGLPSYYMMKDKIELPKGINLENILKKIEDNYKNEKVTNIDGVKIDWPDSWIHLRASNTEPILRIYSEAKNKKEAESLVKLFKEEILSYIR